MSLADAGANITGPLLEALSAAATGVVSVAGDPTGKSDSLRAIQSAVDTGKCVFFPPGRYRMSAFANVKHSNMCLLALPGTVVLFPDRANSTFPILLNIGGVENIFVFGLTFDGDVDSNEISQVLTLSGNVKNVVFDTVTWTSNRGA